MVNKMSEEAQNLNWGTGLTLYEKTRKAILEVLVDGKPRWKDQFYHQFWLRGFDTTSSALTKHLDKLLIEEKIICVKVGTTFMRGDNSQYKLKEKIEYFCSCGKRADYICECGCLCCGEDPCSFNCGGSVIPIEEGLRRGIQPRKVE
jgi:hypothetical protein